MKVVDARRRSPARRGGAGRDSRMRFVSEGEREGGFEVGLGGLVGLVGLVEGDLGSDIFSMGVLSWGCSFASVVESWRRARGWGGADWSPFSDSGWVVMYCLNLVACRDQKRL